jgi:hypothetical protein
MKMKDGRDMYRGSQIAYIPDHAKDAEGKAILTHPDIEYGFINSFNSEGKPFCRYWVKGNISELRTKANSELTDLRNILIWVSVPQSQVDAAIAAIDKGVY